MARSPFELPPRSLAQGVASVASPQRHSDIEYCSTVGFEHLHTPEHLIAPLPPCARAHRFLRSLRAAEGFPSIRRRRREGSSGPGS